MVRAARRQREAEVRGRVRPRKPAVLEFRIVALRRLKVALEFAITDYGLSDDEHEPFERLLARVNERIDNWADEEWRPPEITPEMISAGLDAIPPDDLSTDEDMVRDIYIAMRDAWIEGKQR